MNVTVEPSEVLCRIAAVLALPDGSVTTDTELADVVVDSFALVEMMIELQEDYGVHFAQGDLQPLRTAGDVADLIARHVAGTP